MAASPARTSPRWPRRLVVLAAALLLAAAWGCLVQTHLNLRALTPFVEIPATLWLRTMLQDLAGFGPAYAGIVQAAWLPGLPVAALLARRRPALRVTLFALAGVAALLVAFACINALAPMPALIDATRTLGGQLLMALGSGLGAGLYALLTRPRVPAALQANAAR